MKRSRKFLRRQIKEWNRFIFSSPKIRTNFGQITVNRKKTKRTIENLKGYGGWKTSEASREKLTMTAS